MKLVKKAQKEYSLRDYPCPDQDNDGKLILWLDDDTAVVVRACAAGWVETGEDANV